MLWIDSYTKKDGTQVSGHSRSAPGSGRGLTTLGMVLFIVWAIGGGHVQITAKGEAPPTKLPRVAAPVISGNGAGR